MKPWLLFIFGFLSLSPLFNFLGIFDRGATWVALCVLPLLPFVLVGNIKLNQFFCLFTSLVFALGGVTAIYWGEPRYFYYSIFVISSFFLFSVLSNEEKSYLVDVSSNFLMILVIGAWVGFFLAQSGVEPVWSFPRSISGGQEIYFYYTTITNFVRGDFIRPAGIYDEPGTLSMVICCVAAVRHMMQKSSRYTWALLGLGFVTFSLAHLIYVILHAASEKIKIRGVILAFAIVLMILPILNSSGLFKKYQSNLLNRLSVTAEGDLKGDNRSFRFYNALEYIQSDNHVFWFGLDPVIAYPIGYSYRSFKPVGENPLFPLVATGILVSLPYYLFLAISFISVLNGRRYLVFFGIGLLFIQRPYVMSLGYSVLAVMVLMTAVFDFKTRPGFVRDFFTLILSRKQEPTEEKMASINYVDKVTK